MQLTKICSPESAKQASRRRPGILIVVLWMSLCRIADAQQSVSLAWDRCTQNCAAGYAVYAGGASGQYTSRFDAGTNTTVTLAGLVAGQTNYFVVCAYN